MDSALISFQEGIQYSTRVQDYKNLAALHINGGIVLNYLGRGKEALEQFDIGIEFCDKVGEFNFKMNRKRRKLDISLMNSVGFTVKIVTHLPKSTKILIKLKSLHY